MCTSMCLHVKKSSFSCAIHVIIYFYNLYFLCSSRRLRRRREIGFPVPTLPLLALRSRSRSHNYDHRNDHRNDHSHRRRRSRSLSVTPRLHSKAPGLREASESRRGGWDQGAVSGYPPPPANAWRKIGEEGRRGGGGVPEGFESVRNKQGMVANHPRPCGKPCGRVRKRVVR